MLLNYFVDSRMSLCNSLVTIVLRFFWQNDTVILNTRLYRLQSFFLCLRYSSDFLSCSWRSRHTREFRKLGSLVVSVERSCRSGFPLLPWVMRHFGRIPLVLVYNQICPLVAVVACPFARMDLLSNVLIAVLLVENPRIGEAVVDVTVGGADIGNL